MQADASSLAFTAKATTHLRTDIRHAVHHPVQAGASMAVSEMVIAATLQAGNQASRHLASWLPGEAIRSAQLYGVRPETLDWACK
jgi:tRNA-dihydrouridine synthase